MRSRCGNRDLSCFLARVKPHSVVRYHFAIGLGPIEETSVLKTCPICGRRFVQDEPWKKVCLDCWKKQKAASSVVKVDAGEVQALRDRAEFYERKFLELAQENCRLRQQGTLQSSIKDRLRDLIFLCHPDKHDGDHKATEVTAWLLDVRREVASW